jgi:hypothetical protein
MKIKFSALRVNQPSQSISGVKDQLSLPCGYRRSKQMKINLFQQIIFCTGKEKKEIYYAFVYVDRNLALPSSPVNSLTELSKQVWHK